jgi:hypothetical protein
MDGTPEAGGCAVSESVSVFRVLESLGGQLLGVCPGTLGLEKKELEADSIL